MKMKKVVLSLAGVLAAAAFAPEASAVPVFARQTGMACSACHFNHFPLLNSFGRSFKASGYTLMGSQGKVEGEDLSIPNQLNMAVLTTAGWESNAAKPNTANSQTSGFFVPTNGGELSIFFGGRMTENSGFLSELGLVPATAGTPNVATPSAKMLILPEVAGMHMGLGIYAVGQDAAASFELLNTGATSIHRIMGRQGVHNKVASAKQYVTTEGGATGVSLIAAADNFFVNISKYATKGPGTISQSGNLPGQYVRGAYMFDLAGFDSAVGFQSWSGYQAPRANGGTIVPIGEEKATVIDAQFQGEVGGKGLGVYVAYGTAPAVAATAANNNSTNTFNPTGAGGQSKTAFTIAADYSVAPKMTLQGAYRAGKAPTGAALNGGAAAIGTGATAGTTQSDNALMVGFAYELAMNQHLAINYTTQSGDSWNSVNGVNGANTGKTQTTVLLETLF